MTPTIDTATSLNNIKHLVFMVDRDEFWAEVRVLFDLTACKQGEYCDLTMEIMGEWRKYHTRSLRIYAIHLSSSQPLIIIIIIVVSVVTDSHYELRRRQRPTYFSGLPTDHTPPPSPEEHLTDCCAICWMLDLPQVLHNTEKRNA